MRMALFVFRVLSKGQAPSAGGKLVKLLLPLLLAVPAAQAQFNYTTNNGAITITLYTGTNASVTIPDTIDGLPVTSIGASAFETFNSPVTDVTIPTSITNIGPYAFHMCRQLASITIPDSVTTLGHDAISECPKLTSATLGNGVTSLADYLFWASGLASITIPNTVTNLGRAVFADCGSLRTIVIPDSVTSAGAYTVSGSASLTNVTIGSGLTSISERFFYNCPSLLSITIPAGITNIGAAAFATWGPLSAVYFKGNAPSFVIDLFAANFNVTNYYLPGTTNWGTTYAARPTALWRAKVQSSGAGFGVRSNRFGFNVLWASGMRVVIDGCSSLANPVWTPLQTNTLITDTFYFSDPNWTNYPTRLYRIRSP